MGPFPLQDLERYHPRISAQSVPHAPSEELKVMGVGHPTTEKIVVVVVVVVARGLGL